MWVQTQWFLNDYPVIKGNWKSHRNPVVIICGNDVYSLFGNLFSVEDITICELETILGFFFFFSFFIVTLFPCQFSTLSRPCIQNTISYIFLFILVEYDKKKKCPWQVLWDSSNCTPFNSFVMAIGCFKYTLSSHMK